MIGFRSRISSRIRAAASPAQRYSISIMVTGRGVEGSAVSGNALQPQRWREAGWIYRALGRPRV